MLALAAMGRRLTGLPLAIIGCFRPAPHAGDLAGFIRAVETAGARHLVLPPLSAGAVSDLVSDTVAATPGEMLLAEMSGAAGNPLFVTELVGALLQEGAIKIDGGRAEVVDAALPPTLRLTILRVKFDPRSRIRNLMSANLERHRDRRREPKSSASWRGVRRASLAVSANADTVMTPSRRSGWAVARL